MWKRLAAAALLVCSASAAAEPFDPRPWLEDLEQMRQAFHEKYANLDWLESEREIKLDPLFDQASIRFRGDGSNEVRGILPDEVVALPPTTECSSGRSLLRRNFLRRLRRRKRSTRSPAERGNPLLHQWAPCSVLGSIGQKLTP
jgi:hypothetical protein